MLYFQMKFKAFMIGFIFVISLWIGSSKAVLASANVFCAPPHSAFDADPEVDTAIGCVPVQLDKMLEKYLPYVFGIGGGIAFLLMVYGFLLWATSEGDQKKVAGAKETVQSAIAGLILCVFSLFILRLLAVDILKIPGFTN